MPWSGGLAITSESARPAGSLHAATGRSTARSAWVVTFSAVCVQCGGLTDSQLVVTPAVHGCQSAAVTRARAPSEATRRAPASAARRRRDRAATPVGRPARRPRRRPGDGRERRAPARSTPCAARPASANAIRSPSGAHAGVPTRRSRSAARRRGSARAAPRRRSSRGSEPRRALVTPSGTSKSRLRSPPSAGTANVAVAPRRKPIRRPSADQPGWESRPPSVSDRPRPARDVEADDPSGVREREPVAVRRPRQPGDLTGGVGVHSVRRPVPSALTVTRRPSTTAASWPFSGAARGSGRQSPRIPRRRRTRPSSTA